MILTALRRVISVTISLLMLVSANTFGHLKEQYDSIASVTKLEDGFYMMDYSYDYDIDKMLDRGVSTNVGLLLKGMAHALFGSLKGPGCTTFNSITPDGDYLFSRNFDYLDSDYILVWTHPDDGYASISSVCAMFNGYDGDFTPENDYDRAFLLLAPYVPFDGMNEKGLSIGVLEVEKHPTFQMTKKTNLTTTAIIRAVLDKAATVEEAIVIFEKYDMRDPLIVDCTYHYQIADASGKTAVVEYVDGEMKVIYPEERKDCAVDYLAAANYFLTEGVDDPDGMGYDRVDTVYAALDASKGVTTEEEAMGLLEATSIDNETLHGYLCSTIWSAVYNQKDMTVDICFYNGFDNVYKFAVNEPLVRK